jgi:hypothetical protein
MTTLTFGSPLGRRLGNLLGRIFNEEFFDCLLGSIFLGGIIYAILWYCSSEGSMHPILSPVLFGTFAVWFSVNEAVEDLLDKRFGTHSMVHIVLGGASCVAVFLQLALAFVLFFCATVTLTMLAVAFAAVIVVFALMYIFMGLNGYF